MVRMTVASLVAKHITVTRHRGQDMMFTVNGRGPQVYRYVFVTGNMQWVQVGEQLSSSPDQWLIPAHGKVDGIVKLLAALDAGEVPAAVTS